MQHSVIVIASNYEELSEKRKDNPTFNAKEFYKFARENKEKYNLIDYGYDLFVSTWHSDELINDYKKTLRS